MIYRESMQNASGPTPKPFTKLKIDECFFSYGLSVNYMDELSEKEREALELIRDRKGLLQSNLWKILDCSAGVASKVSIKLEDKGMIRREQTKHNGSSTYFLKPKRKDPEKLDFSLLLSGGMLPPFIVDDNVDHTDDRFVQWIMKLNEEYED